MFYLFSLRGVVILDDALYPARFLRPDDDVTAALQVFLKAHRPMALVQEADGTILRLITLEDILEEIVGEIEDEQDSRPLERLRHVARRETKPAEPAPGP